MDGLLWRLFLVFAPLSLLSIGGGQAIIADIQHQTVNVQHWFSAQQFADMFAISRATPGPNTLIASLIGWQLGGVPGVVVATLAMYLPSSTLFVFATSFWHRHPDSPWRKAIERGLAPIAVGLIFAGAVTILQAVHLSLLGWATTAIATALAYFTKLNPYLIVFTVALFYIVVFFAGLSGVPR
ncbi:chromate transporter [Noviherbaspirillum humi]|uniref:Chromate transporter n=2 Tax=Noviherbaspirillum humi TaxID=1688639 RepID=A0A239IV39_9BURK|nr:chromate transporter [Noviherbaspirillum humi]